MTWHTLMLTLTRVSPYGRLQRACRDSGDFRSSESTVSADRRGSAGLGKRLAKVVESWALEDLKSATLITKASRQHRTLGNADIASGQGYLYSYAHFKVLLSRYGLQGGPYSL
jgi:hypothetical protein